MKKYYCKIHQGANNNPLASNRLSVLLLLVNFMRAKIKVQMNN